MKGKKLTKEEHIDCLLGEELPVLGEIEELGKIHHAWIKGGLHYSGHNTTRLYVFLTTEEKSAKRRGPIITIISFQQMTRMCSRDWAKNKIEWHNFLSLHSYPG
jgi:hypothetical protein